MWGLFSRVQNFKQGRPIVNALISKSKIFPATFATLSASLVLSGALIVNDASAKSLHGIDVDSAIDPFETSLNSKNLPFLKNDHKLIASGVRSVTFVGFKVYGVGIYIPTRDEPKLKRIVSELLKANPEKSIQSLFDDKLLSQEVVDKISQSVQYAVRITPIRNTDFGHLRDGLTKSILANPMAKNYREEVAVGVEELRTVFQGYRGSVPKNKSLWLVSDTHSTHLYNTVGSAEDMGLIKENMISRVLLVSYLSSLQPLSEPLRKNFVSYVTNLLN